MILASALDGKRKQWTEGRKYNGWIYDGLFMITRFPNGEKK